MSAEYQRPVARVSSLIERTRLLHTDANRGIRGRIRSGSIFGDLIRVSPVESGTSMCADSHVIETADTSPEPAFTLDASGVLDYLSTVLWTNAMREGLANGKR